MNYLFQLLELTVKPHAWDFFFVHMSILQTVAMATNNCKDNHFLPILTYMYLLSFLELALVKYLETRQPW